MVRPVSPTVPGALVRRAALPLPPEVVANILDRLDDRDILAFRGVSKLCHKHTETPVLWHQRALRRGYLTPVQESTWWQSDMHAVYKAQAALNVHPLFGNDEREEVTVDEAIRDDRAGIQFPPAMPEIRLRGGSDAAGMTALVRHLPYLRLLNITDFCDGYDVGALQNLVELKHLQQLALSYCTAKLVPEKMAALVQGAPKLQKLFVEDGALHVDVLRMFAKLPQLSTVGLRNTVWPGIFPSALSALTQVTALDLSCEDPTRYVTRAFSESIVRTFPQLEKLSFSGCFVEDPDNLRPLGALPLRALDLSETALTAFPAELCLPTLAELNLHDNGFVVLPPDAERMVNLQVVVLSATEMRDLPAQFLQLRNLREINMSDNRKLRIKRSFANLVGLREFCAEMCGLEEVPSGLLDAPALTHLRLHNNLLRGLPKKMEQLTSLTHLDLRGNAGAWPAVPRALRHMRRLRWLGLPALQPRGGPRFATWFPQLRHLTIDRPRILVAGKTRQRPRPFPARKYRELLSGSHHLRTVSLDALGAQNPPEALIPADVPARFVSTDLSANTWEWACR